MNTNILICGVGGQGTVLASRIIAQAAMAEGMFARTAETIGMAQRGGPVTSHVRIGECGMSSLVPLGGADILLGFEPGETVRNLPYLRKGGLVIVNTVPTKPVTEALMPSGYEGPEMVDYIRKVSECIAVNADEVCAPFGSTKFFNIIMLGIAAGSGRLGLKRDVLLEEMAKRVPAKFLDINREAFLHGFSLGSAE